MIGRKSTAVTISLLMVAAVAAIALFGPPHVLARTSTPDFCSSCHVMEAEFEAWAHTGAHRGIKCVDCHLPNENRAAHYLWKSIDGLKDAMIFYSGRVSDRITVSDHGEEVLQANCIRCHASRVAMVDTERSCWGCHRFLQHRKSGTVHTL